MTEAEQKAREIVAKYITFVSGWTDTTKPYEKPSAQYEGWRMKNGRAKQCALLEVDAIIKALEEYDTRTEQYIREEIAVLNYSSAELQNMDGDFRWWNQVKEALKQL